MSEALHVPYQRDNRARWIITADLARLAAYLMTFGTRVRRTEAERRSAVLRYRERL